MTVIMHMSTVSWPGGQLGNSEFVRWWAGRDDFDSS